MITIKDDNIFLDGELIGYINFGKGKWHIDIIDIRFLIRHIEYPDRDSVINTLLSEIYSL